MRDLLHLHVRRADGCNGEIILPATVKSPFPKSHGSSISEARDPDEKRQVHAVLSISGLILERNLLDALRPNPLRHLHYRE